MAVLPSITRRLFLKSTPAVIAVASGAGLVSAVAPEPFMPAAIDPVFARYVAFLAHEHRAALKAMHAEEYAQMDAAGGGYALPMAWFPEDRDVIQLMGNEQRSPQKRARTVLSAVGLCVPPKSWFNDDGPLLADDVTGTNNFAEWERRQRA